MTTRQEIWTMVLRALNHSFPTCVVRRESAGEDSALIGVGVYGVSPQLIEAVERRIAHLDQTLCVGSDYALIPLVRDIETTKRFYPEHCSAWREAPAGRGIRTAALGPSLALVWDPEACNRPQDPQWRGAPAGANSPCGDLALAA